MYSPPFDEEEGDKYSHVGEEDEGGPSSFNQEIKESDYRKVVGWIRDRNNVMPFIPLW